MGSQVLRSLLPLPASLFFLSTAAESLCSCPLWGARGSCQVPLSGFLWWVCALPTGILDLPCLSNIAFSVYAAVSLSVCAVATDEPGPEGLTSTSLLDFLLPTSLEPLDAEEPSEAMGLGAGLGAPGSGFPSEESEESHILQPPQYFWEEEEELNESSLDLGPTAGSAAPHCHPR